MSEAATRAATPPQSEQNCGNCRAYLEDVTTPDGVGWCRFWPPTLLMTPPVGGSAFGNPESFHPEVKADDWCAQWAPMEK